jgi:hypothetical protein
MSWSICPLLGVGRTTLRAFCLSALWHIYETLYLLLRVQECRFITPSQGTGLTVLSMGDGIHTHLSFRFPDPTSPPSETNTQLLLGRGAMTHLAASCWQWGDGGVGVVILVSGFDLCSLQRPLIELDGGLITGRGEYSLTKSWNFICWTC